MAYKDPADFNEWLRNRYQDNVEFVKAYKIEKGCTDCGYNKHYAGLEFDHIMPRLRGTVGAQMGKSRRIILEEIARCEVVCGTCHNIRTWQRNQKVI